MSAVAIFGGLLGQSARSAEYQQRPAPVNLSIYDQSKLSPVRVTTSDVVRSATRTIGAKRGPLNLWLRLTSRGVAAFDRLTRALARRGARMGAPQFAVFQVNGRAYSRFSINYRLFPNGLDGSQGVEIAGLARSAAVRLRDEIRGD